MAIFDINSLDFWGCKCHHHNITPHQPPTAAKVAVMGEEAAARVLQTQMLHVGVSKNEWMVYKGKPYEN